MLGRPELPKDPRFATAGERPKHLADILDLATQWFAERPAAKVLEALKTADVPHSPIMSMADIFADPHYRAREMLIDVPAEGLGTLPQPGVIPKLSATPGRVEFAGAALGRHTDEILSGLLGMSAAEIARLREGKVI
jgi:formyl-CoA transferase